MDRPFALALGSAACGLLSFATLLLRGRGVALAHLAENATWGLMLGAIVLALLAADGAKEKRSARALIGIGLAAAVVRAGVLFVG